LKVKEKTGPIQVIRPLTSYSIDNTIHSMTSSYERELRRVLAGLEDGVKAVTRSCSELEKAQAMQVIHRPFLVVRAAGSGMEGSGDLLALRGDICFPIEVKTTKARKLYLSGRTWEQYESMQTEGNRCGLMPLYAHRLKGVRGDSWRIFRVETTTLNGRLKMLQRRIPPLPLTRNGKPFIDWEQGMPLHKFLALTCRNEEIKRPSILDDLVNLHTESEPALGA
jgi:Holliday junction resolvase